MKKPSLRRLRPRWGSIGVVAVLLSVPLAVMIGTGTAQAQTAYSVSVNSPASLQIKGQAVVVKTNVTCPAGQTVQLDAALAQRASATAVLNASSSRYVYCTGKTQKEFISFALNQYSPPGLSFKAGSAIVSASTYYCDPDTGECVSSLTASKVVQVSWAQYSSGTDSAPLVTATLGAKGYLRAQGAGLGVPVTVNCTQVSTAGLTVFVDHSLKQSRATDYGASNPITCNAKHKTVQVLAIAASSVPFVAGPVFATADVTVCDNATGACENVLPMRTIIAS